MRACEQEGLTLSGSSTSVQAAIVPLPQTPSMSTPTQASYLATRPPRASEGAKTTLPTVPASASEGEASAPTAQWIVQKYGGTSVGKFLPTITSQIVPSYLASNPNLRLALVCSARSGSTKAKGTTNLLLKAADQALRGKDNESTVSDLASSTADLSVSLSSSTSSLAAPPLYEQTIETLLEEHLAAVDLAVPRDAELRKRLEADVRSDCDRLRQFLYAAKVT